MAPPSVEALLTDYGVYCPPRALLTALVNSITRHSIFIALVNFLAGAESFRDLKGLSYVGYCSWEHNCGDPGNATYGLFFNMLSSFAPWCLAPLTQQWPSLRPGWMRSPSSLEKKGDIIEILLALLRCEPFMENFFLEFGLAVCTDPAGLEGLRWKASIELLLKLIEDGLALVWHCLEDWCERERCSYFFASQDARLPRAFSESWYHHQAFEVTELVSLDFVQVVGWQKILGGPRGCTLLGYRPIHTPQKHQVERDVIGARHHLQTNTEVSLAIAQECINEHDEKLQDKACWTYLGLDLRDTDEGSFSGKGWVYLTEDLQWRMDQFIELEGRYGLTWAFKLGSWQYVLPEIVGSNGESKVHAVFELLDFDGVDCVD